jgi:hypothetical protein
MSAATPLLGAFWLLAGVAGGTAHFVLLRWNTRLYLGGGSVGRALGVQALRMVVTALLLAFAAWHGGALPLLLATIGVLLARLLVLRVLAITP